VVRSFEYYSRPAKLVFEGFTAKKLSVSARNSRRVPGRTTLRFLSCVQGWTRFLNENVLPDDHAPRGRGKGWFINTRRDKFQGPAACAARP